jgi:general secretion pathway protein G
MRRAPLEEGFTLIEMMVVLAIIGLLAAVVIINVLPSQDVARQQKAITDIATLEQALDLYRLDIGRYPSTEQGLDALLSPSADLPQAQRYRRDGYIKRLPADPWGNPYQYENPGTRGRIDIYSFGADGQPGGDEDAADIGNWAPAR